MITGVLGKLAGRETVLGADTESPRVIEKGVGMGRNIERD